MSERKNTTPAPAPESSKQRSHLWPRKTVRQFHARLMLKHFSKQLSHGELNRLKAVLAEFEGARGMVARLPPPDFPRAKKGRKP